MAPDSAQHRHNPRRIAALLVAALAIVVTSMVVAGCADDLPLSESPSATTSTTTSTTTTTIPPTTTTTPTRSLLDAVCSGTAAVTDVGTVPTPPISEASGLAASRRNPGRWWTHNDSGGTPRVFALDDVGALVATIDLTGAENRDWEDIAVGPPTNDGAATVYVADSGDNAVITNPSGGRGSVRIYRFTEPTLDSQSIGGSVAVQPDALELVYPDGPHDSEALLVDPIEGDLVVITKDWSLRGESGVYRTPGDLGAGSTTVMERVATLNLPFGSLVTSADISPDGSVVAVRGYERVRLYPRPSGQPVWTAFSGEPCSGPAAAETLGESIGFAADGGSYMTVSEGEHPLLHRTSDGAGR